MASRSFWERLEARKSGGKPVAPSEPNKRRQRAPDASTVAGIERARSSHGPASPTGLTARERRLLATLDGGSADDALREAMRLEQELRRR